LIIPDFVQVLFEVIGMSIERIEVRGIDGDFHVESLIN
jgi:hypothetical protein